MYFHIVKIYLLYIMSLNCLNITSVIWISNSEIIVWIYNNINSSLSKHFFTFGKEAFPTLWNFHLVFSLYNLVFSVEVSIKWYIMIFAIVKKKYKKKSNEKLFLFISTFAKLANLLHMDYFMTISIGMTIIGSYKTWIQLPVKIIILTVFRLNKGCLFFDAIQ